MSFKIVQCAVQKIRSLLSQFKKLKNIKFTRKNVLMMVTAILIIGLALFYFWSSLFGTDSKNGRFDPNKQRPISVLVAPVETGDVEVINTALGTVIPRNTVTVHSQVDGKLLKVLFQEGQIVKAGQVLAQIDPRNFEAIAKQAQGQLDKDRSLLRNAEIDLKRYKTLLDQDSIAEQQYATQKELVKQYQGVVLTDQGQLDAAKLQLEFTTIVAPFGGRIGLRLVDPGNIIHASDANGLFVITQTQPATVIFSVPQDILPAFDQRMKEATHEKSSITVQAWDRDNKILIASGKLDSIDNQIDPTTGTVKLRAIFANEEGSLFPNQFVNVKTVLNTLANAVIIPTAAIQRGSIGVFVYVAKEDKTVAVRPIKIATVNNDKVAVSEGLTPGEKVVIDGVDKLRDGIRIEIGDALGNPSEKKRRKPAP